MFLNASLAVVELGGTEEDVVSHSAGYENGKSHTHLDVVKVAKTYVLVFIT